ncbi:MAG: DUF4301 family protein [Bacteroidota bacterium]
MLTEKDLQFLAQRGSDLPAVQQQLDNFKTGFPFLNIRRAATVGDGIIRLDEKALQAAINRYEAALPRLKVIKFVPASGAASRMFKALFAVLDSGEIPPEGIAAQYLRKLADFAFTADLGKTFDSPLTAQTPRDLIQHLLTEKGLNYGNLPKGLLAFHQYEDGARTPVEEHLVEAANYATTTGGTAYLHFTVSPEHRPKFEELVHAVQAKYEAMFGVSFDISFSEQKASTDTIAVSMDNQPFRNEDGTPLFRPGGHGALIENLNDLDADVMFIKNIDNVVPDHLKADTFTYKKAIAGLLLDTQEKVFTYLDRLQKEPSEALIAEVQQFVKTSLCIETDAQDPESLMAVLDRPMRVCGMVKNEGEPGGGPFWVENSDGSVSLQIAESAQIDPNDPTQSSLMQDATHFNPVDLVCATRNHAGESYDLLSFRDPKTGFVAYKSKDGRELKAQELPGLWNGAMAKWITLFVEVPISTFNPVKTVSDLLRPQHQTA